MTQATRLTAAVMLASTMAGCSPAAPNATNGSTAAPAPAAQASAHAATANPPATPNPPATAAPGSAATTPADAPPVASPAASAAASGAAPASATPAAVPAPTAREVTIPANTRLTVTLATPVASDASRVEDVVLASLAQPVVIDGTTVLPSGTELRGTVLQSTRSGRVKGKASVAFRFDRMTVRGEARPIQTARIAREAASSRGSDVKKGAIGGAVGAVVGGIAGGGSGAAIGAAAGGTGTVLATRGNEVRLPAGTTVTTTLQKALTVLVPID